MSLAIIADKNFEVFFDEVKSNLNYKDVELDGLKCIFLSTANGSGTNLSIIKKMGVNKVIEITEQNVHSEEIEKENDIEYTGFSIKGDIKKEYIKPLIRSFLDNNIMKYSNSLTPREKEVLLLISDGMQNKEIAKTLFLSEKTVKNHVSNIFKKIDVNDRTKAALFAIKNLK